MFTRDFVAGTSREYNGYEAMIIQVSWRAVRQAGRKEKKSLQTTVTIEFTSDTKQHLRMLEHSLKHIHDVKVDLVEPKDPVAPVLIAIGITKGGARGERAAQNVAQTLYSFLHEDTGTQSEKKIFLVTIEGERIDIEPLTAGEIERIILEALEGEIA